MKKFSKKKLFSVISLQQNNDESVAANETVGANADKGDADEKSDQFIVTQEYIQDSTCVHFFGV